MLTNFGVAIVLGALMGLEREMVGKEAGIRTSIMVAGGAAIFSLIALNLPYIITAETGEVAEVLARNSGFLTVIANIVVGIGFLGAGIIIKTEERVHGLTTAAVIWAVAAVGTLAGIGLLEFAAASAIIFSGLLYILRKARVVEKLNPDNIN
ncbi:MAG: MgtC/SapB transporter [Parcubacteria group bacterium GW2011_GWA1_59_11]|nr:MAG: MgtC/SapB transporter [Parcubacteria group bacterium GW2011_GWA1_59_11]